jgi:hypothetical protein
MSPGKIGEGWLITFKRERAQWEKKKDLEFAEYMELDATKRDDLS